MSGLSNRDPSLWETVSNDPVIAGAASSATLLAANNLRKKAWLSKPPTTETYIKLGAGASASDYHDLVPVGGSWELDHSWRGIVSVYTVTGETYHVSEAV